jgi:hypothetical protein
MQYLAIFLIAYGVFMLIGWLLKFPFLYNNMKSKLIIKKMGKTGFEIMLILTAAILIVVGILIL